VANPTDKTPQHNNGELRRNNYNRIAREARLVSVVLESLDFKIDPEAYTTDDGRKREFDSNLTSFLYDSERGICISSVKWIIKLRSGRSNLMKCSATYNVVYDNIKADSDDVVRIFANSVGRATAYGYFRGLFAHIDWSANLRSPPLPVARFNPQV
jgi:hypothetical protein